jgi:hypothetical protein
LYELILFLVQQERPHQKWWGFLFLENSRGGKDNPKFWLAVLSYYTFTSPTPNNFRQGPSPSEKKFGIMK